MVGAGPTSGVAVLVSGVHVQVAPLTGDRGLGIMTVPGRVVGPWMGSAADVNVRGHLVIRLRGIIREIGGALGHLLFASLIFRKTVQQRKQADWVKKKLFPQSAEVVSQLERKENAHAPP